MKNQSIQCFPRLVVFRVEKPLKLFTVGQHGTQKLNTQTDETSLQQHDQNGFVAVNLGRNTALT